MDKQQPPSLFKQCTDTASTLLLSNPQWISKYEESCPGEVLDQIKEHESFSKLIATVLSYHKFNKKNCTEESWQNKPDPALTSEQSIQAVINKNKIEIMNNGTLISSSQLPFPVKHISITKNPSLIWIFFQENQFCCYDLHLNFLQCFSCLGTQITTSDTGTTVYYNRGTYKKKLSLDHFIDIIKIAKESTFQDFFALNKEIHEAQNNSEQLFLRKWFNKWQRKKNNNRKLHKKNTVDHLKRSKN